MLTLKVRLASVRRSLFTGETERSAFLARLVTGTRDVLRSNQGLAEHANYHEFCRLLGRLKTNYQLSELVRSRLAPVLPGPSGERPCTATSIETSTQAQPLLPGDLLQNLISDLAHGQVSMDAYHISRPNTWPGDLRCAP